MTSPRWHNINAGRRIVMGVAVGLICISALVEGLTASMKGITGLPPSLIRLGLVAWLSWRMVRGENWARWVVVVLLGVGSALGILAGVSTVLRPPLLLLAACYLVLGALLTVGPGVGAFFRRKPGGFEHWLTDRGFRAKGADMFEMRDQRAKNDLICPPDMDALVDALLDGDTFDAPFRLNNLGLLAAPALLKGLQDPRCVPTPHIESAGVPQDHPALRLVSLLTDLGEARAVPNVLSWLESPVDQVRDAAVRLCAASGDEVGFRVALDRMRKKGGGQVVARPLSRAAQAGRLSDAQRCEAFDAALRCLDEGKSMFDIRWVPDALLAQDRDRATAVLSSEELFHPQHPAFHSIVEAMNQARASLPAEVVLLALRAVENSEQAGGHQHGELLNALALSEHPAFDEHVEVALQLKKHEAGVTALEALCHRAGIPGVTQKAVQALFECDWNSLSEPARVVAAATRILDRVYNGGLWNVYGNGIYHEFSYRIRAFEAIDCPQLAEVIREADRGFGPGEPPEEVDEVEDVAAIRFDELDKHLASLERRFFERAGKARILVLRYALEHADTLRDPHSSQVGG